MLRSLESMAAFVVAVGLMVAMTAFTVATLLAGDDRTAVKLAAKLAAKPRERRGVRFADEHSAPV